jgi:hypothetical protein
MTGEHRSTRRKTYPRATLSTTNTHGLACDRTQTSAATARRLTADDLARLTFVHNSSYSNTNYLASLGSVKCSLHYKQPRLSDGNTGALSYRGVSMRLTSPGKLQLLVHPSHLRACGRGWLKLRTSARVRPHTCRNNSSLWDVNTKLSTRNNAQHWLWWAHVIRWYSHLLETIANT